MFFKDSNLKLAIKNLFLPSQKKLVVLEPHMGLGDSLICLGLVKALSAKNPDYQYYFACLPKYYHSVSWMLKDLGNVFPLVVNSGRQARQYAQFKNARYLPIGVKNVDILKFDESFYAQHQIPFDLRWKLANTPAGLRSLDLRRDLNSENRLYRLVCRTDSSGTKHQLTITSAEDLATIEIYPVTNNIFDWTDLVLGATEIHTIDTAFIHFVENTLQSSTSQKLFFHRIRQSSTEFTRRLPWRVVEY